MAGKFLDKKDKMMCDNNSQINKKNLFKITTNAGIAGFGNVVGIILGYVSTVLITRFIGPELYGIFLLALTVISIGAIFSRVGLDNGLLRFVALYKGQSDSSRIKGSIIFGTGITFLLSLIFSTLLFFLSGFISIKVFNKPELETPIKLLAIGLPFTTIASIWLSSIQGFQIIKYKVYTEKLIQPTFRLFFLVVVFLLGLRLFGVILASIVTSVLGFLFSFYYLEKIFPFHKKKITPIFENKRLMQFSTPLFFEGFLSFIIGWLDVLMIGYFMTSSNVGIYGAVVRVSALGILILSAFNIIFAPMISELYGKKEMGEMEDLFKTVTKWIFSLSFPLFLLLVFFAKPIMSVFGSAFVVGAPCLIILSIARLVDSGVGSVGYMLMMTGRPKMNLLNSAILCIMNIGLNYMLIPKYGILGAAIATGLSIAIINLLRLGEVYYFLRIHPYKLSFLKPLSAGIISIVTIWLLKVFFHTNEFWLFGSLGVIFIAIYSLLLKLFKFEEEDIIILGAISKKLNLSS